jgi:exodeoxyribonuclease VII large subunit
MPAWTAPPRQTVRERDVYTVSRLNREARGLVEGTLGTVWLEGEVSNFLRHGSGHWYFSLKDDAAQVRCAMFRQRNAALGMVPRNGMQVLVRARASLYEPRGEFQLVVDHLEEAGEGELRRRYERLKRDLAAEGLFDTARKRPLPRLPRRVGVVTSQTGAAIRDILHVLARRFPAVPVVIYPVPVQGAGAAEAIAAAIRLAGERAEADLLIVGRGGGSLEDLWAFNEEAVVRAIVASPIPVVSAVGHEVDVTLSDLAADLRAPTPSAAAELVVPDAAEWLRALAAAANRLLGAWQRAARRRDERLAWAGRRLAQLHPALRVEQQSQRLDELGFRLAAALRGRLELDAHRLAARRAELVALSPRAALAALGRRLAVTSARLPAAVAHHLSRSRDRLAGTARALNAVSPLATLERGYAIVTRAEDGHVLTDAAEAAPGSEIEARLARGRLRARVLPAKD